jgi:hypothetical protein
MPIYTEVKSEDGIVLSICRTDDDGAIWSIPLDQANSDYQRYLNPEAEHFTPMIPSDE